MLAKLFNLRLHPAAILTSVLFWAIVVLLIYIGLMYYWIQKMFFSPDKPVSTSEFVGTSGAVYAARTIFKKKLSQYKIF